MYKLLALIMLFFAPTVGATDIHPVGTIIQSLLTQSQFTAEMGPEWRLVDGSDIAGTDLARLYGSDKLPDAQGKFLRMKNIKDCESQNKSTCTNDPQSNRHLGSIQEDDLKSHSHSVTFFRRDHYGEVNVDLPYAYRFTPANANGGHPINRSSGAVGGHETRPKNIAVNMFIKVDRCQSKKCK